MHDTRPDPNDASNTPQKMVNIPRILLVGGFILIFAIYSMGWSGTLHFDDEANLGKLAEINDASSALYFIFGGGSGPTGRPISLATFALQHQFWPDPRPFLIFNTGLHLANAFLVFLLLTRLLTQAGYNSRTGQWLAVVATLLWAGAPFLAGTTLMVVQRMTGMSAFFLLLAALAYIYYRPKYCTRSLSDNLTVLATIGFGTILAGFSKENGFLLPVFLLLIEWLLRTLKGDQIQPLSRIVSALSLFLPSATIIGYLVYRGFNTAAYELRDFTLLERLVSQGPAIVSYIRELLIPTVDSVTPFHDSFKPNDVFIPGVSTVLSLAVLLILFFICWRLRTRYPLITFGLLWFFLGHLVESTTLPLELYFPHRNYVPSVGLFLVAVLLIYELFRRVTFSFRAKAFLSGAYLSVNLGVLAAATSLWGSPKLAAEMWLINRPDSLRATTHLYRSYYSRGDFLAADLLNERLLEKYPQNPFAAINSLWYCGPDKDTYRKKIERARQSLLTSSVVRRNHASQIQLLAANRANGSCRYLDPNDIDLLVDAALTPPERLSVPKVLQTLLFTRLQIAYQVDDYELSVELLERILDIEPSLDASLLMPYSLAAIGDWKKAEIYVLSTLENIPAPLPQRLHWRNQLHKQLENLRQPDKNKALQQLWKAVTN